ncbi:MAG: sugar phosphate isomerase/epimerase [Opitutales bacterium]|nr:sugar phosphate isomerase/epimerase [Opitutales bacterium]
MHTPSALPVSISDKGFGPGTPLDNLKRLRAHGFTHLHFAHKWTFPDLLSDDELARWREDLAESGISVLDVHGCHPKGIQLWSGDAATRERAQEFFCHRLRVTHALGGDAMVYHVPCHVEPTPEVLGWFIEGLREVEPTARELGINVALENHYYAENDRRALSLAFETFDADFIGFTFDPGHALISGNTQWLLEHCAPRLRILHLNDNDTQSDHHWNPLDPSGKADWTAITAFIGESPYCKPLQLEVCWKEERHGPHEVFLSEAFAIAKQLQAKVEANRQ